MSNVLKELRRRRVFRTLALYIVGTWGLLQIADVLFPAIGLAESDMRYLLIIAIAGFPVALVFGWMFDISSDGIHRTAAASAEDLEERNPLRGADYLILVSLMAVLGLIAYGVVENAENIATSKTDETVIGETSNWRRGDGPPMIGVLPFSHLGGSEDGEFFANGVHDDLLTSLSKISGLRIISRTSVLQYVGTTKAIPEIGRELRADAILEGGIRVSGNQIRINAQLIDARSDEHLWAETYDRELTASNIFEVQSEIARAISTALQTTLTQDENDDLDIVPTSNLAAYRAYHEIMQWRDTIHLDDSTRAEFVEGLEKAFSLDPAFTRPMAELVGTLALSMYRKPNKEALARVEELINRIGEIAPDSTDHFIAQSFYFYYVLEDFDRAIAFIEKAQARAPSDARLLDIQSWIQRRQGDFEGWLESSKKAQQLAPKDLGIGLRLVARLMGMHRYDEAREAAREVTSAVETDDPGLKMLRSQLALADHQSLPRLEKDLETILEQPHLNELDVLDVSYLLWEVQMAQHRFMQAQETIKSWTSSSTAAGHDVGGPGQLSPVLAVEVLNALIVGDPEALGKTLNSAKKALDIASRSPNEYVNNLDPPTSALLAIADNEPELARKTLAPIWNDPKIDRALWFQRNVICQGLALAGAAKEATDCLRNTLDKPSSALHFLEPRLAYYDPIRYSTEFQTLWQELIAEGWIVDQP
ncbi:hypothetical protein R0137_03985 [Congregibacter brevis]|uniref:TolB amino-terminal domain-containing protein n=1 Tax=Congregibacter brevis TaxID=3081201 RepID=A0ABZ0IFW3_9GAMM|nr:hypothetical protein R0137_03985 [Congregibacter sp. IMCC45268]